MNPISQIAEFLPRYVSLFYVDYRDSLDEHEDIQEKCLRSNSLENLYEKSFEWYESQEQENLEEYMDETRRNMEKAGLSGLFKEHEEQIRDLIYERNDCKYSINSLVYWVTYVHNVVYSFYRSMIYCYINSTQRCAGSIVIDIIPTNGADKRKFFPFAPYFPVTNVIKRYFYPYFPAIIGIKGYSFPYFPYLSGIMKIKTALYSLFSRLDWHKTVVFPCLGEIYEGIRSLSWEIPVT